MSGLSQPLVSGQAEFSNSFALSTASNQALKSLEAIDKSGLKGKFKEIQDAVNSTYKYNAIELPFECRLIKLSAKHSCVVGTSSEPGLVVVKNLEDDSKTLILKATDGVVTCLRFNKEENQLFLGDAYGKIFIYEFPLMNQVKVIEIGRSRVVFDVYEELIYACSYYNYSLTVADINTGSVKVIADAKFPNYIRVSCDGKFVAMSENEQIVIFSRDLMWKQFVYKIKRRNEDEDQAAELRKYEIEFFNTLKKIGISYENVIEIWDIDTGKLEDTKKLHNQSDITSIKFSSDDSFLLAVGYDHSINIWDLSLVASLPKFVNHPVREFDKDPRFNFNKLYYDLEIDEDRNLIYSHALNSKYSFQWRGIFVDKASFPDSKFPKDGQRCIVNKRKNEVIVTKFSEGKLLVWDIESLSFVTEVKIPTGCSWEVTFADLNETRLLVGSDNIIYEYNANDYTLIRDIKDDWAGSIYCLRTNINFIISGGSNNTIVIQDHQGFFKEGIKCYNSMITGMKISSKYLITGDANGFVGIHILGTWEQYAMLKEHDGWIRTIETFSNEDTLITVARDGKCIFWSIYDKIAIKVTELNDDSGVDSCYLSNDERRFFLSGNSGLLSIYNLPSFRCMTKLNYKSHSQRFAVDGDEKYFIVSNDHGVYRTKGGIASDSPMIIDDHIDIPQIRRFLHGERKRLVDNKDSWVIAPYMVNSLHYYADENNKKDLKNAMNNNSPYIKSSLGTPLDIALLKGNTEAAGTIIAKLKARVIDNNYALETLSDCLCELNKKGFKGLDELYNECLIKSPEKLPVACADDVSLPIVSYSLTMKVNPENFIGQGISEGGKRVTFLISTIRMNLEVGSKESIDFLESLLECSNTEVFKTKFIKTILYDKWDKIKWIMYLTGIIFVLYLISLSIYIVYRDPLYLYIALVLNVLSFLYEVLQMYVDFIDYWKDFWNYIDLSRAAFFYVYFYFIFYDSTMIYIPQLLLIVTILSWVRGITLFSLSTSTRYMVSLLGEVIKDIIAFAIVVFYSILSFAFIKLAFLDSQNFGSETGALINSNIIESYFEAISGGDSSNQDKFILFLVIVNSIFNVIIMMNLLISILGTTYGRVNDNAEVADSIELTEMIIEAESLYFHKRNEKKRTILQICEEYTPPEIVGQDDIKLKLKTVRNEMETIKGNHEKFYEMCISKFEGLAVKHGETQTKMENNKKEIVHEIKKYNDDLRKELITSLEEQAEDNDENNIRKLFVCLNEHALKPRFVSGIICNVCKGLFREEEVYSCAMCDFDMCQGCANLYYSHSTKKTPLKCRLGHIVLHFDNINEYLESTSRELGQCCRFCNTEVNEVAFCCIPCMFFACSTCVETFEKANLNKDGSLKCKKSHTLAWKHKDLYKENLRLKCTVCKESMIGAGFFTCTECPSNWCLSCIKKELLDESVHNEGDLAKNDDEVKVEKNEDEAPKEDKAEDHPEED
ncbi:hypothetical protein SteCoe_11380 [Stentor coeruleus]|uniref:Ion transport domain-containing protein n=1 Tax=Stentor coeruleus TaxID=5963 RepID=A0A1R2CDA8_9CILI|nr:hypothetical protein SteCoe_11380 [Stentor coeruleus]